MKSRSEAARIGIVIYDGVEPIDVGGTAGVVSMARRVLPGIACVMIAERTGPVRLAGDVTVMADADFHNAPPCDVFIVCGGPGWREQVRNPAMLDFLKIAPARGDRVGLHRRAHSRGRRNARRPARHDAALGGRR